MVLESEVLGGLLVAQAILESRVLESIALKARVLELALAPGVRETTLWPEAKQEAKRVAKRVRSQVVDKQASGSRN